MTEQDKEMARAYFYLSYYGKPERIAHSEDVSVAIVNNAIALAKSEGYFDELAARSDENDGGESDD